MKSGFPGALALLFAGVGWALAQGPQGPQGVGVPAHVPGGPPPTEVLGSAPSQAPFVYNPGGVEGGYLPSTAISSGVSGAPIWFGSADYLLWRIQRGRLPSAVTTQPVGLITVDTSDLFTFNQSGSPTFNGIQVTGYAPVRIVTTSTLGSGSLADTGASSGGRLTFGFWLDPDQSWGVEVSSFFLERSSDEFSAVAGPSPNQISIDTGFNRNLILITGMGERQPLGTFPVLLTRQVDSALVGTTSTTMYSGEFNGRSTGMRIGGVDVGGLVGFRYLAFREDLTVVNDVRLFLPPGIPPADDFSASISNDLTFRSRDRTRIWNNFYGGQVGVDLDAKFGSFFINTRAKVALGNMHQVADVDSTTTVVNNDTRPIVTSPPASVSGGGLLASPADNGRHSRDVISFIPEVNVRVGCQFTNWLRGYVGYDYLQITNAARPGLTTTFNTINTDVRIGSGTQTVNVSQPAFRFQDQNLWVQGFSFGLEAKY